MKRPNAICHVAATVNGRIIGEHWGAVLTLSVSPFP